MKKIMLLMSLIIQTFIVFGQSEYKLSRVAYISAEIAILDAIINSPQFDSINNLCSIDSCRFLEDEELFIEKVVISLKEQNPKFTILNWEERNNACYWILGDFYINPYIENPKEARVQLTLILEHKKGELNGIDIGIEMEKNDNQWHILYFATYE